ncbi:UNVERIFIED_CONTAM: hypothetical protein Sangu_3246400 [Sesamum angustifolium]|uniref:DUF4283 domain-containing protein n=1 Tax=Sesamum angustifolium TaxID=2727405 RepID=A0AAW2JGT9_9LAMI
MLPKESNSLCPLSHNTHTDSTHTTHSEPAGDDPDGNIEENVAEQSNVLEGGTPCNVNGDFDFEEFYDLATRVLNGDTESMESLNSLKVRWEQKFKTRNQHSNRFGRQGECHRSSDRPSLLSPLVLNSPPIAQEDLPEQPAIYVGNVKLQASAVDSIAERGNCYQTDKGGVDSGSKKWQSTAVGYFLGRRPYFPQLESFARANWKGLQHVSATTSGFFFFRFCTRFAMEEVIEGGPWLFQGQPIVLQVWEQGMSLRRQQHTQIPVWIRLKHLPMEYWTDEGLSTVASGVGTPLYTDGITKECSRLDYARVCVMLDFNSELPKHLIVISPVLRNGKEDPKRVDVEYEWVPQKCTNCRSLGHVVATCPAMKKRHLAPPITIFVQKLSGHKDPKQHDRNDRNAAPALTQLQFGAGTLC